MYVIAMNRLSGAYVDLDPGIERYFLASANDDVVGAQQTYYSFPLVAAALWCSAAR